MTIRRISLDEAISVLRKDNKELAIEGFDGWDIITAQKLGIEALQRLYKLRNLKDKSAYSFKRHIEGLLPSETEEEK